MRNYFITTDSNSDMPPEIQAEFNTCTIPQYYSFGSTVYGDELNMPAAEFYQRMKNGELPKSQANNPAVIEEKFRKILDMNGDVIHIAFSSALSASYNNVYVTANALREEYPDAKITVIDSLNVSLAETILVIQANRMKEKGAAYEDVVAALEAMKHHINVQFTVDDLFHLHRGGRMNKTTAMVGSVLNMKPFMTITREGTLKANGTVRGRKKSLRILVDRMKETLEENADYTLPVGIVHGNCKDDALAVAEMVKAETPFTEIIISDVSPSIGVHSGPGALGLLYYGKLKPQAEA